jgi:hypothetical protein
LMYKVGFDNIIRNPCTFGPLRMHCWQFKMTSLKWVLEGNLKGICW